MRSCSCWRHQVHGVPKKHRNNLNEFWADAMMLCIGNEGRKPNHVCPARLRDAASGSMLLLFFYKKNQIEREIVVQLLSVPRVQDGGSGCRQHLLYSGRKIVCRTLILLTKRLLPYSMTRWVLSAGAASTVCGAVISPRYVNCVPRADVR